MLVALYPTGKIGSDNSPYYHCKCDCGKEIDVLKMYLTRGDATSCGCRKKSAGAVKIETLLRNKNIDFEREKKFDNCRDILPLPFDFYLYNKNTLIEFDGQQHYHPISCFGD